MVVTEWSTLRRPTPTTHTTTHTSDTSDTSSDTMRTKARSTVAYRDAARRFKAGAYPCHLAAGPWCTGRGTTVDHVPPLSTAHSHDTWRGLYLPACKPCQDRQGGQLAHHHPHATTRWHW